jgi:hypothetical protein
VKIIHFNTKIKIKNEKDYKYWKVIIDSNTKNVGLFKIKGQNNKT